MKLWLLKQFNYYWDVFFTFIDNRQVLLWHKLKQLETKWEYEDIEELDNYLKNMENYKDWEDVQ